MEQQNFSSPSSLQQPKSKGVKPFWVVILLVLVLALVGVLVWQKNNANQIADSLQQQVIALQNQAFQKNNQQIISDNCFKEGVLFIDPTSQICCDQSLHKIIHTYYDENGKCLTDAEDSIIADETYVCADCGNGVCGKGETQCNCPADCK